MPAGCAPPGTQWRAGTEREREPLLESGPSSSAAVHEEGGGQIGRREREKKQGKEGRDTTTHAGEGRGSTRSRAALFSLPPVGGGEEKGGGGPFRPEAVYSFFRAEGAPLRSSAAAAVSSGESRRGWDGWVGG